MFELLWFLLPIAAASGWWAAKRDSEREHRLAKYLGLRYLFAEKPEKTIDALSDLLFDADQDTLQLELTLGSALRKRGEVDRAIEIHAQLAHKLDLSPDFRAQAQFALAEDYLAAGLLDRAESLFRDLTHEPSLTTLSLAYLVRIYEQEREWLQAIATLLRWQEHTPTTQHIEMAHCYCELAEIALRKSDYYSARSWLDQAINADAQCARASLLFAHIALIEHDYQAAITALSQIQTQQPALLPETLAGLQRAYSAIDAPHAYIDWLQKAYQRWPSALLVNELALQLALHHRIDDAILFLKNRLVEHPNFQELATYLHLRSMTQSNSQDIELVMQTHANMVDHYARYQCQHCGFITRTLHWRCASCQQWNTAQPAADVTLRCLVIPPAPQS